MDTVTSKNYFVQFLFLCCIVVSTFPNYELTFFIWSVAFLLSAQKKYSTSIVRYSLLFLSILVIAFISSFFNDFPLYKMIRDVTYLVKPILGLFVGYQLCKFASKRAFRVFIYTGLFLAIIHLMMVFIAFLSYKTLNMNVIRAFAGYFSDYEIYVIILLIFRKKFQLAFSENRARILLTILIISSSLYLARTNVIQIVILYIGMKGYFTLNKKSVKILSVVILSVLAGYSAIYYANPKRNGKGLEGFLYKIKIAPIEPFKTKINKEDWKDFNDNYRSYENIIAVKQVSEKGFRAVFFGEGLGSTLDLGREVLSNDGEFVRYIPIVHNGYMTVFLKSGILGVLVLISFLVLLFRQNKTDTDLVKQINYLLIGTAVFLIFSNWVFLGLYLKLDNKSIIIGFLLSLKQVIQKENNLSQNDGKN